MVNSATQATGPTYEGSEAEQQLAQTLFGLYQARGAFFAATAPIILTVESLVEALTSMGHDASASNVQAALEANGQIFAPADVDDGPAFVTTKNGTPPGGAHVAEDDHGLAQRFATPEPPRERVRPRSTIQDLDSDIADESVAPQPEFPPDSWQAAVAAALREAGQETSDVILPVADEPQAEISEILAGEPEDAGEVDVELVAEPEPEAVAEVVDDEVVAEPEVDEEIEDEVVAEAPVVVAEPEPAEEIEISDASDDELADAIEIALRDEPDALRWGNTWMHRSNVAELTQDDLNKIQEILGGASEAVSDYALVRDLGTDATPGSEEFEIERFSLNYRMSLELSLFEFVGTARQSLWTTAGVPAIATEKRSNNDIGQDYRFLLDYRTPDDLPEPGLVEHVLTFYEHRLGVLPLNANFATIMPKAAFNDQRSTRLTVESPQTFETFEVDLRYPTSNRGGFIVGFEEFFAENLVPGAVISIEATRDQETHFIIEFFQISRQDRKLLQFNERREKFVFQAATYFCATQDDMLIDDNHFERLADVEPLDEEARRQVDQVVRATFERVGIRAEDGDTVSYRAHIVDLLAGANIERPISEPYLRDILHGGAYPEFTADESEEDVFVYAAPAS